MKNEEEVLLELLDSVIQFERDFNIASDRFNIFDATGMSRQEIRHSRFLGFLLNPSAPHGLGDRFLRTILGIVIAAHDNPPINRLTAAIANISTAVVYFERDHFDITIHVPELKLLLVIENKISSTESDKQLENYRKRVASRYADHSFVGIFLTPDGYPGEDDHWIVLSYRTLVQELRNLTTEGVPHQGVALALVDYIDLIERNVVASEELMAACKKIYAKHKRAFDLIIKHGQASALTEAFDVFSRSTGGIQAFTTRPNDILFIASDWSMLTGFQVASKRWGTKCPVQFWFQVNEKCRLFLRLEVGPVEQAAAFDREEFVKQLRKKLNPSKSRISSQFTRIKTQSVQLEEDYSVEDLAHQMKYLWKTVESEKIIDVVLTAAQNCIKATP